MTLEAKDYSLKSFIPTGNAAKDTAETYRKVISRSNPSLRGFPPVIGSPFPEHAVFGEFFGVIRISAFKNSWDVQKGSSPFLDLLNLEILIFVTLTYWILMAVLHRIADGLIALSAFFIHPH